MFDRIAGRYDLLNRVMTMGIDRRWRRAAVRATEIGPGREALDVCCGTGDLTFLLARTGAARVTGIDFSANMLHQARLRVAKEDASVTARVEFIEGDALNLPFEDASFDAVTVGFGVRNVEDLQRAFEEFNRVVRPGGKVVCLEITRPRRALARIFYELWFDRIVPLVGGLLSGDREAYRYLPESTRDFPAPDALAQLLRDVGLESVEYRLFAGGIVALHTGCVADDATVATSTTQQTESAAGRR